MQELRIKYIDTIQETKITNIKIKIRKLIDKPYLQTSKRLIFSPLQPGRHLFFFPRVQKNNNCFYYLPVNFHSQGTNHNTIIKAFHCQGTNPNAIIKTATQESATNKIIPE